MNASTTAASCPCAAPARRPQWLSVLARLLGAGRSARAAHRAAAPADANALPIPASGQSDAASRPPGAGGAASSGQDDPAWARNQERLLATLDDYMLADIGAPAWLVEKSRRLAQTRSQRLHHYHVW